MEHKLLMPGLINCHNHSPMVLLRGVGSGLPLREWLFDKVFPIEDVAKLAEPFLAIGNQYGEGWFLTGEMAELLTSGTPNIVCIQPFACLPNHVVGKGVIKALRKSYPWANIVAVDYDPGASEVNQLNRIKLMLSSARRAMQGGAAQDAEALPIAR